MTEPNTDHLTGLDATGTEGGDEQNAETLHDAGPSQNQPDPGPTRSADIPQTAERDPDEWVTGDEEMTGPQKSYLHTLAHEAGEQVPDNLSKAEASKLIDRLQQKSGRGQ